MVDRVLCILHGYLLEGSGSNLWTRLTVKTLCEIGEMVHLMCQENHPEEFDFISKVIIYESSGEVTTLFEREIPYEGKCVMHKPRLGDTLPVYLRDKYEEFENAVPMVELPTKEIEMYIDKNVEVLRRIVECHGITQILVNHAVLMSIVAKRIHDILKVPYSIIPHGSALTYAVEKDKRIHNWAAGSFSEAERIFINGEAMSRRLLKLFPTVPDLEHKFILLNLGVDTKAFKPIAREERNRNVDKLLEKILTLKVGRDSGPNLKLFKRLEDDIEKDELLSIIESARNYDEKLPDANLTERLGKVDWVNDDILIYLGRLIANKGVQNIVMALPLILEKRPNSRLIIVGHGPLREVLEMIIWSIKSSKKRLLKNIVNWGADLEGSGAGGLRPFHEIKYFIEELEKRNEFDNYLGLARKYLDDERILFTGYLVHDELKYLLPCADVTVLPSKVPEAGPLVLLEALSSGVLPLGTDIGGFAQYVKSMKGLLPDEILETMKLGTVERSMVNDIVVKVVGAMTIGEKYKDLLRKSVAQEHDWKRVVQKLVSSVRDAQ